MKKVVVLFSNIKNLSLKWRASQFLLLSIWPVCKKKKKKKKIPFVARAQSCVWNRIWIRALTLASEQLLYSRLCAQICAAHWSRVKTTVQTFPESCCQQDQKDIFPNWGELWYTELTFPQWQSAKPTCHRLLMSPFSPSRPLWTCLLLHRCWQEEDRFSNVCAISVKADVFNLYSHTHTLECVCTSTTQCLGTLPKALMSVTCYQLKTGSRKYLVWRIFKHSVRVFFIYFSFLVGFKSGGQSRGESYTVCLEADISFYYRATKLTCFDIAHWRHTRGRNFHNSERTGSSGKKNAMIFRENPTFEAKMLVNF